MASYISVEHYTWEEESTEPQLSLGHNSLIARETRFDRRAGRLASNTYGERADCPGEPSRRTDSTGELGALLPISTCRKRTDCSGEPLLPILMESTLIIRWSINTLERIDNIPSRHPVYGLPVKPEPNTIFWKYEPYPEMYRCRTQMKFALSLIQINTCTVVKISTIKILVTCHFCLNFNIYLHFICSCQ